jgi:hypothetical protein
MVVRFTTIAELRQLKICFLIFCVCSCGGVSALSEQLACAFAYE